MSATLNGSHAPEAAEALALTVEERLAAQAQSLEDMLGPIEARKAQLEAELSDLSADELRINAAIEALTGRLPKHLTAPTRKASRQSAAKPGTAKYDKVSEETVERIYAYLKRQTEPTTVPEMRMAEELTDVGDTSLHSAVAALRNEGRVRLTGVKQLSYEDGSPVKGKRPNAYEVMPNES